MPVKIRIAGTEYSLKNKSFEIYVQGCYRKCPGCHNPDTQPFDGGKEVDAAEFCKEILEKIKPFGNLIQNIYVTGGDILCQKDSVAKTFSSLVSYLFASNYTIWLFTGAEEKDLPYWVWDCYDVIKCGSFDKDNLNPEGTFPASKNQKLFFNKDYRETNPRLEDLFNDTEFVGEKKWK